MYVSFPAIAICVIAGMLAAVVVVVVQCWAAGETRTNGHEDEGEHRE